MDTGYRGVVLDTGRQGLTGIWILDSQEQSWILGDKVYQVYGYWIHRSSPGFWETRFNRYMDTGYRGVVLDTGDKVQQVYAYWVHQLDTTSSGYWETRSNRYMDTGYTSQTQLVLDTGRQGLPGIWILVRHNQFWIQGDKVCQVYGYQLDTTSSGYRETRSTRYLDTSQTQLVLDTGRQGLPGIWILLRHNQFWIQGDPRTKINIESLVLS